VFQRVVEPHEPGQGERVEQLGFVLEVSARRVVADPARTGQLPQRQRADPALAQHRLRRGQQGRAQIAVVVGVRRLDLTSLDSVRAFAADWGNRRLDVLVNNAGVANTAEMRTADGFELQMATNHLGHFALTNLLLPCITGRVVTVTSESHYTGRIELDDLNWERRRYRAWPAFARSKLANIMTVSELQRRFTAAGSPVLAMAAHPGLSATNLSEGPATPSSASPWKPSPRCSPRPTGTAPGPHWSPRPPTCPAICSSAPADSSNYAVRPRRSAEPAGPTTSTSPADCGTSARNSPTPGSPRTCPSPAREPGASPRPWAASDQG
jgi:NAD(P)-dependent dehydrogenase (short-subunit alcohol dehydrogenase family)